MNHTCECLRRGRNVSVGSSIGRHRFNTDSWCSVGSGSIWEEVAEEDVRATEGLVELHYTKLNTPLNRCWLLWPFYDFAPTTLFISLDPLVTITCKLKVQEICVSPYCLSRHAGAGIKCRLIATSARQWCDQGIQEGRTCSSPSDFEDDNFASWAFNWGNRKPPLRESYGNDIAFGVQYWSWPALSNLKCWCNGNTVWAMIPFYIYMLINVESCSIN